MHEKADLLESRLLAFEALGRWVQICPTLGRSGEKCLNSRIAAVNSVAVNVLRHELVLNNISRQRHHIHGVVLPARTV